MKHHVLAVVALATTLVRADIIPTLTQSVDQFQQSFTVAAPLYESICDDTKRSTGRFVVAGSDFVRLKTPKGKKRTFALGAKFVDRKPVYRAQDVCGEKEFAVVKYLDSENEEHLEELKNLETVDELLGTVTESSGKLIVAMPYVRGADLGTVLTSQYSAWGRDNHKGFREVMSRVAKDIIGSLLLRGFVHEDLNLQNIIVQATTTTANGEIPAEMRAIDFGFGKVLGKVPGNPLEKLLKWHRKDYKRNVLGSIAYFLDHFRSDIEEELNAAVYTPLSNVKALQELAGSMYEEVRSVAGKAWTLSDLDDKDLRKCVKIGYYTADDYKPCDERS